MQMAFLKKESLGVGGGSEFRESNYNYRLSLSVCLTPR